MSNDNNQVQLDSNGIPVNSMVFAMVVDGEVAWMHSFPTAIEAAIAAFSSDPKIVVCPDEVINQMSTGGGVNYMGWTYADGVFSPPSE